MNLFRTKYRVSRDRIIPSFWAVQFKVWFWPFWIEHGNGLLVTRQDAQELISLLTDVRS